MENPREIYFTLKRTLLAVGFTLGTLVAGGHHFATVEDEVRELKNCTLSTCQGKVEGKTAIPAGTYEIKDTYSPRFKKNMLELQAVPGFRGIRIHSGNTADDTEGCLILGMQPSNKGVIRSNEAMQKFNKLVREELAQGKRVFLRIE